jgi:hypothetical protein
MTCNGELDIEKFKAEAAHELELTRLTAQFEHAAMRPLYLLNGGALIATLTYLGHALSDDKPQPTPWAILTAMALWLLGLFFAGLTAQFGYNSQLNFLKAYRRKLDQEDEAQRTFASKGHYNRAKWTFFRWVSLLCFLIGSSFAIVSILHIGAPG